MLADGPRAKSAPLGAYFSYQRKHAALRTAQHAATHQPDSGLSYLASHGSTPSRGVSDGSVCSQNNDACASMGGLSGGHRGSEDAMAP
eukprot:359839-Chlamydomonas_euryale.AAC.15